jgi:hypothetical protein
MVAAGVAIAVTATLTVVATESTSAQARPNFVSDIAPIIHANCASCHRPDEPATFSLLSYDDVKSHASEIRIAVTSRQMPPWNAAPARGFPALLHDRRLSAREIAIVSGWIDAGMPSGDLTKTPMPPSFPAGWPLGLPDLTVSMPHTVPMPADNDARVFNVVFYMNFSSDRWISAIDYQPSSSPGRLSHALLFAVPAFAEQIVVRDDDAIPGFAGPLGTSSSTDAANAAGDRPRWNEKLLAVDRSVATLGVWTPGGAIWPAPEGTAMLLPKGTNIVMQFHAKPSDTGAIEDGTLALYFARTRPAISLSSLQLPPLLGVAAGIDLAAGAARTVVRDALTLPVEVAALGARAHGHLLARDFKMTARLPNGSTRGLLWIDRWKPAWQETYYFTAPVRLPKGTTIQVEITYEGSPKSVAWGPRLTDEIGAMDLVIASPAAEDGAVLEAARAAHFRNQLLARKKSADPHRH